MSKPNSDRLCKTALKAMKICISFLAAFVFFFSSGRSAFSHPHAFVDCMLTLVFDDQGLTGFKQRWILDEMFSGYILEEYDPNGDSVLDKSEFEEIRSSILDEFKNYHYFTHVLINGTRYEIQSIDGFSVQVEKGKLVYDFFTPCPVRASSESTDVVVSLYDETYYKLLTLLTDSVTFQGKHELEIEHTVRKIEEFKYYYDQIVPHGVWVRFQAKALAQKEPESVQASGFDSTFQGFVSLINSWQKQLKTHLTRFGREIRKNPYGKSFWLFLLFSFVYGMLHALGPGHGKSIVCSYFLSRPGNYFHGILMGNLITFVHVGSAVAVVLVFYFIFKTRGMTSFEETSGVLQKISYALLTVLGLVLIVHKVHELKTMRSSRLHQYNPDEVSYKSLLTVALATGLVPCPGAAIILIFAITLKILAPGLLAMVCVALGMGLTTSLFALVTIASRNTIFRAVSRGETLLSVSYAVLSMAGALLITVIGIILFLQA